MKIRNYRARGTLAKVNLALTALPQFRCVPTDETAFLSGRIHLGPTLDYIERAFDHAKYGEMSADPWLDVTIPSILDPDLAPPGAHVMSIYVHYTPFSLRHGDWPASKDLLLQRVLATLEQFAPGVSISRCGRRVDHARGTRVAVRFSRRPHLPRRADAGSTRHDETATGLRTVPRSCPWAVSVRRRHASRWFHDRRQRKAGGPRNRPFIVVAEDDAKAGGRPWPRPRPVMRYSLGGNERSPLSHRASAASHACNRRSTEEGH